MHSEKPIYTPPYLSEVFPVSVLLIDGDLFLSFKGKSLSASSFYTSLLQVLNGVMSVALSLQVVSQAPQHFRSSGAQATFDGCFFRPVYLLGHFPPLWHVQGSTSIGVLQGGCRQLAHDRLGLPFHFSLFVPNTLNLWGMWHGWLTVTS